MNFAGSYEPPAAFLMAWISKATVLLALAWVGTIFLRRQSAALRHRLWTIAIAGCLALPLVALVVPAWHAFSTVPAVAQNISQTVVATNAGGPPPVSAPPASRFDTAAFIGAALLLWAAGTMLIAFRVLVGLARLWSISRYARQAPEATCAAMGELRASFGIRRKIRLLECASAATMPMTWGVLRPRILLPAGVVAWDEERCRIVLSHELVHVGRNDWILQVCAEALRACFWFHPLAWIAANRLRQESERACDDGVLNSGIGVAEYAAELLALAQTLRAPGWRFSLALAIARPSNLERRFAAMLDSSLSKRPLSRRSNLVAISLGACLLLPIAALTLSAEPPRAVAQSAVLPAAAAPAEQSDAARGASITGAVVGRRGSGIPGLNVTLIRGELSEAARTDADGEFLFSDLAPGVYTLHIERPWPGVTQSRTIHVVLRSRTSAANIRLALGGSDGPSVASQSLAHEPSPAAAGAQAENASQTSTSQPLGSISGSIADPHGAMVPRASVMLADVATGQQQQITAGPVGEFTFSNLIPDSYELSVSQPGFRIYKQTIQVFPSEQLKLPEVLLSIGEISQTIVVSAKRGETAGAESSSSETVPALACSARPVQAAQPAYANPVQSGPPPRRIRVGGNVEPARLIQQTMPIYPAGVRGAGIQGTVVVEAIIGKDGSLLSPCVVSGPAALAQSALDAFSQWRYSPVLLDGEPVEALTQIGVVFTLDN